MHEFALLFDVIRNFWNTFFSLFRCKYTEFDFCYYLDANISFEYKFIVMEISLWHAFLVKTFLSWIERNSYYGLMHFHNYKPISDAYFIALSLVFQAIMNYIRLKKKYYLSLYSPRPQYCYELTGKFFKNLNFNYYLSYWNIFNFYVNKWYYYSIQLTTHKLTQKFQITLITKINHLFAFLAYFPKEEVIQFVSICTVDSLSTGLRLTGCPL